MVFRGGRARIQRSYTRISSLVRRRGALVRECCWGFAFLLELRPGVRGLIRAGDWTLVEKDEGLR